MYASKFCSVSYLKCFGISLLELEMVELYKKKREIYLRTGFILPPD